MSGRPPSKPNSLAQFKAAQLRQSILQAAVQGKLVPQNLHDEPAFVLLERIRAEKALSIKEGKIKKEKPLPLITEDEIPYDLPEGWVWCRLGEVCSKIGSGSTPRGGKNAYLPSGIPFLRSQNIWNDGLSLSHVAFISVEMHDKMSATAVFPKDILLNITGGSLGRCTLVSDSFVQANVSQHVTIIRLCECALRRFIHYLLLSPYCQEMIWSRQIGMAREGLSKKVLELFEVPLPPLAEQQRIVTKVDELMTMCDELEAAEKKLDALEANFAEYLPKSILQAAVQGKLVPQNIHDEPAVALLERIRAEKARLVKEGKIKKEKPLPPIMEEEIPYDLPEGWEWCRVGDICQINPRNILADNLEVAFVPMTLISDKYFGRHQQEHRLWGNVKSGFTHFSENDVALAKITPCFQNGKSCIMRGLKNAAGAGTTELHILRCRVVQPEYVLIYVKHPGFLTQGVKNMTGTAGQQRVPTEYLRQTLFPLPPLAEQQRIVAKVDELMALCEQLKATPDLPVVPPLALTPATLQQVPYEEPELLMAARGRVSRQDSEELRQAQEDLFGE